jgi:hypothetical protein
MNYTNDITLIDISEIFLTIKNNLNNTDIIDTYISYINQHFNEIDIDELVQKIIEYLDDDIFIVSFLNPLMNKIHKFSKLIFNDIISSTSNITHLKNIFIFDIVGIDVLFNIFKFKTFDHTTYSELLTFIYYIGKENIILQLINLIYKTKLNYEIMFKVIMSLIVYHNNNYLVNNNQNLTQKLLHIIDELLFPLFELNEIIMSAFNNQNVFLTKNNINILNNFLIYTIDNKNNYFNILIIKNSTKFIDVLYKHTQYNESRDLIDKLVNFIDDNLLNIHDKTSLLLKIIKYITDDSNNFIPINLIYYINYYLSNVKFLEWSTFDEKINILFLISKIFFKLYKTNSLDHLDKKLYYNLLYNLFYYEKESITIIDYVIKNEVLFTTYTLMKETIYGLVTVLNIFVELEIFICERLNNLYKYEEYDYIIYKNNLNMTSYILFLTNNSFLNKFNTNIMLHHFTISKYILLYNQLINDKLPYIGLDYDKINNYYNKNNIKLPEIFIDKFNNLYKKLLETNNYIDMNPNAIDIDQLFAIKIENPYRLPKSNETYEKIAIRLLIHDTQKNPFTREIITLEELDNYNS